MNAIEVNGLSKVFKIGATKVRGGQTIGEKVSDGVLAFKRRLTGKATDALIGSEDFWALKDISFTVKAGEVLGIVGHNGAGKSTLLKVLCRITPPTEGEAILNGRVASLLEVSTGFHQELTGRENIYFSGAVLGMKKAEINNKLDEIISFSGVEKFIDTPVKRYSSGMLVRLGFAVAAHLEPDILLIDEVLAVGDAAFQKKCLGKMSDVASGGRTVIFVSHNMAAVNRLCTHGMVLDHGKLAYYGSAEQATRLYFGGSMSSMAEQVWSAENAPGDAAVKLLGVRVLDCQGELQDVHDIRKPIHIVIDYNKFTEDSVLTTALAFMDEMGTILFVSPNWYGNSVSTGKGEFSAICTIPGNFFAEGMISVVTEIFSANPIYTQHVWEKDSVAFQVVDDGGAGSVRNGWGRKMPGVVRPLLDWETKAIK